MRKLFYSAMRRITRRAIKNTVNECFYKATKIDFDERLQEGHLQIAEQNTELSALEDTIERGFKTFLEVGQALVTIRDKCLYKPRYATFEDYCQVRWKFSRQRAYQLMSAAQVAIGLSTIVDIPNESIARQFARLENPEHQRAAAMLAIATAPEGKITASWVESTIDVMTDVENTGGFVDIGKRFAVFNAGITHEEHQKMIEKQRQISAGKQKPLTVFISDGYDLRGIGDRIEGFAEQKRYRIVIYEVVTEQPGAPDSAR